MKHKMKVYMTLTEAKRIAGVALPMNDWGQALKVLSAELRKKDRIIKELRANAKIPDADYVR